MTWAKVAAFIVPLAVVICARRRPAAVATKVLWFIEPLILAWVLVSTGWVVILYDPDIGAYVAIFGVGMFLVGWIGEAYGRWRSWRVRRPTAPPRHVQ